MKRYQFRLDGVLRLRRAELEQARVALGAANAAVRGLLVTRDLEAARYGEIAHRCAAADRAGLLAEREEARLAADRLADAERRVANAAVAAAVAQVNWSTANRRVAALERLEVRRRAEHAAEVLREEAALLDDVATARFLAASDGQSAAS